MRRQWVVLSSPYRAYIQIARKNGKTFLMACVALYEALFGEIGGEAYLVPGDRMQASRGFAEIRKIVEADPELRSLRRELGLISGPSGLRPDLDVAVAAPIAASSPR